MLVGHQNAARCERSRLLRLSPRFSAHPMLSHERAVTRVGRHLIDTADKGLTCRVNKGKGLECYADALGLGQYPLLLC